MPDKYRNLLPVRRRTRPVSGMGDKVVAIQDWIDEWVRDERDVERMLYTFRKKFPGEMWETEYRRYTRGKFGMNEDLRDDGYAPRYGSDVEDTDVDYEIENALDHLEDWFRTTDEGKQLFKSVIRAEDSEEQEAIINDDVLPEISLFVERELRSRIGGHHEYSEDEAKEWFMNYADKRGYKLDIQDSMIGDMNSSFKDEELDEVAPILGVAARAAAGAAGASIGKKVGNKVVDKVSSLIDDDDDEIDEARQIKMSGKDKIIARFNAQPNVVILAKLARKGSYNLFVYDTREKTGNILARFVRPNGIETVLGQAHNLQALKKAGGIKINQNAISELGGLSENDNAKKLVSSGAWNKAEKHTKYDPPKTGNKRVSARKGFVG